MDTKNLTQYISGEDKTRVFFNKNPRWHKTVSDSFCHFEESYYSVFQSSFASFGFVVFTESYI